MNRPDEIFIPDVILPFQFYDRARATDATMPIRRLMLAVLTDALDCLSGRAIDARGTARQQEASKAAEWVALDSDMYLFSFNSVCETLGIDPDALRKALKSWCGAERRLTARLHFVPRRTKVRTHRAFARRRVAKGQNRSRPDPPTNLASLEGEMECLNRYCE
jgi:hypothetical protein